MPSNRTKAARAFSDTYYTGRSSPVVMVNRRRTPEVVCQVQGPDGGFDDTIEVTLKQKRSPRRMTIVYQDDDYGSEEADVVVRSRAVSRHRRSKSTGRQQVDESSPTTRAPSHPRKTRKGQFVRCKEVEDSSPSSSGPKSDSFSDETIVEKKTAKKVNVEKTHDSRKKRRNNVFRDGKREENKPHDTLAQGDSTTSLASVQSVIWQPIYVTTVPPASALPTSANYNNARMELDTRPVSTPAPRRTPEPEPTSRGPLSVLARRFGHRSPWMKLIGIKNDNSREPDTRPRASKTSNNGHYRSHAGIPMEAESSGDSSSLLEGYRHQCYGCDRFRSDYWQDERRPRKGEMIKPSLCGSCRQKLRSAYNKVHGPRGEDLSTLFWCRVCGFRRSSRFHRQHREPSETFSSLNNTCNICVEDQKRRNKIRQGKRRAIEQAEPMYDSHAEVASPGGSVCADADRTFSTGSALYTAPNDSPRKHPGEKQKDIPDHTRSTYHRPTADPETESMAEGDSRKAKVKPAKKTLRRSRASVGARSVVPVSDHPEGLTDVIARAPAPEQPEKDRKPSGSSSGSKKINKSRVPNDEKPESSRQASGYEQHEKDRKPSSSSSGSKNPDKSRVPSDEKPRSSRQASGCEQLDKDRKPSGSSSGAKPPNESRVPGNEKPRSSRQASDCEQSKQNPEASSSSSGPKKHINTGCSIRMTTTSSRRSSHAGSSKYSTAAKARDRISTQSTTSKAKPAGESHDNFATKPSKGADSSSSSGFANNSAESWARLDIDGTLRDAIAMDPRELAARQARLMGKKGDVSPAPSVCFEGPRVWEIDSNDEA